MEEHPEARARSETVDFFIVDSSKVFEGPKAITTEELMATCSPLELEIFELINTVRKDPVAFAKRIEEEYLQYMDPEGVLRVPGAPIEATQEGKEGVNGAIAFLHKRSKHKFEPLIFSHGLVLSARDHVGDQWMDENSPTGHGGSDGSTGQGRGNRYGTWKSSFTESLCYGERDPFRIITRLIIDDGIPSRANRKSILDPNSHFAGVAYGAHRSQGGSAVILICHLFENNLDAIEARPKFLETNYKKAMKRKWYSKNSTITKTRTTTVVPGAHKRGHCITM